METAVACRSQKLALLDAKTASNSGHDGPAFGAETVKLAVPDCGARNAIQSQRDQGVSIHIGCADERNVMD